MPIGVFYEIVVMERSSSVPGTSQAFELLETPEEASSGVGEFQHVGGGGGAVGDMNTAMIVMGSVCGKCAHATRLVVVCTPVFFYRTLVPELDGRLGLRTSII